MSAKQTSVIPNETTPTDLPSRHKPRPLLQKSTVTTFFPSLVSSIPNRNEEGLCDTCGHLSITRALQTIFRNEAHKNFASPCAYIVLVFSVEWGRLKTVGVRVRKYSQHQKDQKKVTITQFDISKVSILWIHAGNEFTVDNYLLLLNQNISRFRLAKSTPIIHHN